MFYIYIKKLKAYILVKIKKCKKKGIEILNIKLGINKKLKEICERRDFYEE